MHQRRPKFIAIYQIYTPRDRFFFPDATPVEPHDDLFDIINEHKLSILLQTARFKLFTEKINEIKIEGGHPLKGEIEVQGAKNEALPVIASALLTSEGTSVIKNIPLVSDVFTSIAIAKSLGAQLDLDAENHTLTINAENIRSTVIPSELSEKSRGSVLFLGGLLGRFQEVSLSAVGGCVLGTRKLDYHLRGFARLGANVNEDEDGSVVITVPKGLHGNYLYMDLPSHTGTENLIMAAVLANGETIIDNAAVEPEVVSFAKHLVERGARIEGIGTNCMKIIGVKKLAPASHTIIPDRNVASALAVAVGATRGDVTIKNYIYDHQKICQEKLHQMGLKFVLDNSNAVLVQGPSRISPINVIASPYPGFATDTQPAITTLATVASGRSFIRESVFDKRFTYVDQLTKFGADIILSRNDAIIVNGVTSLKGADVVAEDIRGGFALLIAALTAEGTSVIRNTAQIDRGVENYITKLRALGAKIETSN